MALSDSMTDAQRASYAAAGYWAMYKYAVAGLPSTVATYVNAAIQGYANAYDFVTDPTSTSGDQLAVLQEADHVADQAIAQFRFYGLSLPNSAPAAVRQAVAKLPPVTQPPTPVTAVALPSPKLSVMLSVARVLP